MARRQRSGLITAFLLLAASSAAQDKPVGVKASLPKIASASVPFSPPLARQTHIDGAVTLRVSTDGQHVSAVEAGSGHRLLVNAAKENVKTWQFEPHTPTSFEVEFHYRLLPIKCDAECACDSEERESVLLHLPANAEISAKGYMTCDPAQEIVQRRTIWRRLIHQTENAFLLTPNRPCTPSKGSDLSPRQPLVE